MIMRKVFNSLSVIIAAMVTFAGCAKQEIDAPNVETKTVHFFAESIETKTEFGTPENGVYPTIWSNGDKVKILVNLAQVKDTEKTVDVVCSEDFKSASFVSDLAKPEAETFTFYSISPSVALLGKKSESLYVTVPSDQKPLPTSVDKAAQILYAASETTEIMPSSVELSYRHLTAYGKLSLVNLASEVTSVSSVKLEAPADVYLAGKWDYYVTDGSLVVRSGNGSNIITLTTDNATDIWFACAPVDMSDKTLTITVTTDKGDLVKEITFPANRRFEAGKIAKFAVDMKGIGFAGTDEPEQPEETEEAWTLVTDVAELSVGDKVVIAAAKENYALATTQNSNNRASVAITKSDNVITINDDVQVITIEEGADKNSFAFNVGSGYLYAASTSSNHLKTKNSLDANGSWSIEISESGVATIKSIGNTSKGWLRFNSSNSPKIFSCYGSGQTDVAIYRLTGTSGDEGETPAPEAKTLVSIAVSGYTETYTVGDTFEFGGTVTATYDDESTANVTASATFAGYDMQTAGTQNVTVSYTENGVTQTTQYEITVNEAEQPAEPIVSTVAEFLAAQEDDAVYELTGVITSVNNTEYGNFYLNDSTGEVLIYGLCSPEGEQKYWAASGVAVGDIITVRTVRSSYNGTAQGKNALYVSSVNFDINPTDINVNAEDTTAKFDLSCDAGYYIEYPDGVEEVSEVHNNETASVTYSVKFPANTDAETKTYVIKIIADADLILENPIEGVEYARTVTITQAAKPTEGEDAEPAWTLVTDVNELAVGDQVVIVAKNANYAMSTTQNSNNRAQATVTKNGNIITFGSDVQILTLKAGKTTGTYSFYTGSGYLYAASSSKNYLKTETNLSANSSWKIEITSAGVATIKAQGSNTRNWLRYNSSNNPPLFSCYSSGQADVCIYKLQ